jgi:hypothetical protein
VLTSFLFVEFGSDYQTVNPCLDAEPLYGNLVDLRPPPTIVQQDNSAKLSTIAKVING